MLPKSWDLSKVPSLDGAFWLFFPGKLSLLPLGLIWWEEGKVSLRALQFPYPSFPCVCWFGNSPPVKFQLQAPISSSSSRPIPWDARGMELPSDETPKIPTVLPSNEPPGESPFPTQIFQELPATPDIFGNRSHPSPVAWSRWDSSQKT